MKQILRRRQHLEDHDAVSGNVSENGNDRITLSLPGGGETVVRVRRSRRARRFLLHVDVAGETELVLPRRAALAEAVAFARDKAGWIERHLNAVPRPVPFTDGCRFPLLGEPVRVRHVEQLFDDFWRKRGDLYVACPHPQVPRRVEGWLRTEAARQITLRAADKAARIERTVGRITIGDTRSQWGSCSYRGNLNFSWRLVMAPEAVLDYVVAHEVAHLVELNHTDRFWTIVEDLCADTATSRTWLRRNGAELHRYGADVRSR